MINFDITKEYKLPISESLRGMRIQRCPLDCGDRIFVDDRLESSHSIKIFEFTGGTFYIPVSADELKHSSKVVPVAGVMISVYEKQEVVQVDKVFCELGYEDFIAKLMKQILNFADFYGLRVSILDLRKDVSNINKRTCRFVDLKYWE